MSLHYQILSCFRGSSIKIWRVLCRKRSGFSRINIVAKIGCRFGVRSVLNLGWNFGFTFQGNLERNVLNWRGNFVQFGGKFLPFGVDFVFFSGDNFVVVIMRCLLFWGNIWHLEVNNVQLPFGGKFVQFGSTVLLFWRYISAIII